MRKVSLIQSQLKLQTSQLSKTQVNDELNNEFSKSAKEITITVNFCNKGFRDTISKYNQLKLEFDNKKFN